MNYIAQDDYPFEYAHVKLKLINIDANMSLNHDVKIYGFNRF